MPAFAPLTFNLTTPAASQLVFEPVAISGGLASYTGQFFDEPAGGGTAVARETSAALSPTMTVSLQKPTKTSRISKARVKIVIPQPVVVNGVTTTAKDREASLDITFMSSERALPVEKKQLVDIISSLIYNSTVLAVFEDNKSIY